MRFNLLRIVRTVPKAVGARCYSTNNFKTVTHCIFDMDGLLLDTEQVYKKMITQLCAQYGHTYTDELMMKILGGTEQRLSEILCKELNLPVTPTEFRDQLLVLGDKMLAGTPLLDGAEKLIRHLHKTKVPFALATSSSERSVKTKVAAHKELFQLFHHMVMGSSDKEVKFGKPHPDIFLVAANRFPDKPEPSKMDGRAHSPPGVKWLLEPIDIYNVNAPPTSRYKFQGLSIVTTATPPFEPKRINASRQKWAGWWYLPVRTPKRSYHQLSMSSKTGPRWSRPSVMRKRQRRR